MELDVESIEESNRSGNLSKEQLNNNIKKISESKNYFYNVLNEVDEKVAKCANHDESDYKCEQQLKEAYDILERMIGDSQGSLISRMSLQLMKNSENLDYDKAIALDNKLKEINADIKTKRDMLRDGDFVNYKNTSGVFKACEEWTFKTDDISNIISTNMAKCSKGIDDPTAGELSSTIDDVKDVISKKDLKNSSHLANDEKILRKQVMGMSEKSMKTSALAFLKEYINSNSRPLIKNAKDAAKILCKNMEMHNRRERGQGSHLNGRERLQDAAGKLKRSGPCRVNERISGDYGQEKKLLEYYEDLYKENEDELFSKTQITPQERTNQLEADKEQYNGVISNFKKECKNIYDTVRPQLYKDAAEFEGTSVKMSGHSVSTKLNEMKSDPRYVEEVLGEEAVNRIRAQHQGLITSRVGSRLLRGSEKFRDEVGFTTYDDIILSCLNKEALPLKPVASTQQLDRAERELMDKYLENLDRKVTAHRDAKFRPDVADMKDAREELLEFHPIAAVNFLKENNTKYNAMAMCGAINQFANKEMAWNVVDKSLMALGTAASIGLVVGTGGLGTPLAGGLQAAAIGLTAADLSRSAFKIYDAEMDLDKKSLAMVNGETGLSLSDDLKEYEGLLSTQKWEAFSVALNAAGLGADFARGLKGLKGIKGTKEYKDLMDPKNVELLKKRYGIAGKLSAKEQEMLVSKYLSESGSMSKTTAKMYDNGAKARNAQKIIDQSSLTDAKKYFSSDLLPDQAKSFAEFEQSMVKAGMKQADIDDAYKLMYGVHKANNSAEGAVAMSKVRELVEVKDFMKSKGVVFDEKMTKQFRALADKKILGDTPAPSWESSSFKGLSMDEQKIIHKSVTKGDGAEAKVMLENMYKKAEDIAATGGNRAALDNLKKNYNIYAKKMDPSHELQNIDNLEWVRGGKPKPAPAAAAKPKPDPVPEVKVVKDVKKEVPLTPTQIDEANSSIRSARESFDKVDNRIATATESGSNTSDLKNLEDLEKQIIADKEKLLKASEQLSVTPHPSTLRQIEQNLGRVRSLKSASEDGIKSSTKFTEDLAEETKRIGSIPEANIIANPNKVLTLIKKNSEQLERLESIKPSRYDDVAADYNMTPKEFEDYIKTQRNALETLKSNTEVLGR